MSRKGRYVLTGWTTTDGAEKGRIVWLQKHYPNYYDELLWMLPVIREYV